jgi:hypothetical protein
VRNTTVVSEGFFNHAEAEAAGEITPTGNVRGSALPMAIGALLQASALGGRSSRHDASSNVSRWWLSCGRWLPRLATCAELAE